MRPVPPRPHVLGIDDGPFEKQPGAEAPLVGVMMEGPDPRAIATGESRGRV